MWYYFSFSCRFIEVCMAFYWKPGTKGLCRHEGEHAKTSTNAWRRSGVFIVNFEHI